MENNEVLEIASIPNSRFNDIKAGYKSFYNKEHVRSSSKAPSLSFFTKIAVKENVFVHNSFIEEDIFRFSILFYKTQPFNPKFDSKNIKYENLSNKFLEKRSLKDKELEKNIRKKFPHIEIIKVSNFLFYK